MIAAPSRDWKVFTPIFAEPWEGFTHAHPRYRTSDYDGLVATRLACGNPEQMGSMAYRCLHCGQGKHRVAMSGQSSLCWRCAKVSVDNWVSQVSQRRHAGVISRHLILPVPALFRPMCSHHAAVLLRALRRCGVRCMAEFSRPGKGKALQGGFIGVRHTPGRHGPSHPPRPRIAPRGGCDGQGQRWEHLQYVP
jgi:hypothetical protein